MNQTVAFYSVASLSAICIFIFCLFLQGKSSTLLIIVGLVTVFAFDFSFINSHKWDFDSILLFSLIRLAICSPFALLGAGLLQSIIDDIGNFGKRFWLFFISTNLYGCFVLMNADSTITVRAFVATDWIFLLPFPIILTAMIWAWRNHKPRSGEEKRFESKVSL